jgi:membrane-associated phospholipid phosphatase
MHFLTDFADQAVVLPLALAMAVSFWLAGWPRAAIAWSVSIIVTFGVVAVAKLLVFAYGPPALLPLLLSPSGHTASAALVYGGLACLLTGRAPLSVRMLIAACLFAATIGLTRVALRVHSAQDVLVGAAIGIVGTTLLAALAGERPQRLRLVIPIGVAASVLVGFHGLHMPAEDWLHELAEPLK